MGTIESAKQWRPIVDTTARVAFSEASPIRELAALLKKCGRLDCDSTWQRRSGKHSRAAFCTIWGLQHILTAFTVQCPAAGWIISLNCSLTFCCTTIFCPPTV